MPDLRGKFRGLTEVVGFWRGWLEAWDAIEFDEELTDAGDNVLAVLKRQTMRGKCSGIEVEFPPAWMVFTVLDGLIVRQVLFLDEGEALEAAGLSE